jgi:hypothetical protein
MRWKLKAKIQNSISLLPSSVSYETYYWIQRNFGGLKQINPIRRLASGIDTWKRIQEQNINPFGKVFFEVGAGRVPLVPLAYWLMGAKKTISIDLNPYFKEELIKESIDYMSDNEEEILSLFGSLIHEENFSKLLAYNRGSSFSLPDFLDLCRIDYIAPGDASCTGLPDQSIDFHTSLRVFEHIPEEILKKILKEGNRIVKKTGMFIHGIDYSDHFSHSDKSISSINFLQFSDGEWKKYAGNRYMYMNRLRHDDFLTLFKSVGHRILDVQVTRDERAQEVLSDVGFQLDKKFNSKSDEILGITGAWIMSQSND